MLLEPYAKMSTSLPDIFHFTIWISKLTNATILKLFLIMIFLEESNLLMVFLVVNVKTWKPVSFSNMTLLHGVIK
jgi:hypothetical protein